MPIVPLPQFEADLEADRKTYEALKPPKTIVVRFGSMKMVGEFPYDGDAKPGCGSKLIVRTHRGTELGEMLTSTCPNSGCSKSVSRQEMLKYVENSGGRDYPFTTEGRVLRIATKDDMDRQARIDRPRHDLEMKARAIVERLNLPMKIVDAEPILGGERLTFFYIAEERVDFRDLLRDLSADNRVRIELRQVGARDEARLTADYERCGQYCCCKNFLKVLKPVSMRSAKTQKATLDPLKISGRCGRLMCCLRYEDETYEDLRKRLPRKKSRVGTPEGNGWVVDSQILTQLVLVQLEAEDKQVAIAVEDLTDPTGPAPVYPGGHPVRPAGPPERGAGAGARPPGAPPRRPDRAPQPPQARPAPALPPPAREPEELDDIPTDTGEDDMGPEPQAPHSPQTPGGPPGAPQEQGGQRRRRRRRRRRGGGGQGGGTPGPSAGPPPAGPPA